MKRTLAFAAAGALLALANTASALCLDTLNSSTPVEQFVTLSQTTTLHKKTSLEWQRCPLGQTASEQGNACLGVPLLFTWDAALRAAAEFNASGGQGSGWYVPNISELSSIVERRCYGPAINTIIFPTDVAYPFWSSTPERTSSQQTVTPLHFIDFDTGIDIETKNRPPQYAVRLVRQVQ